MANRRGPLAPLAPLFAFLNWVACLGWSYVLYQLIVALLLQPSSSDPPGDGYSDLLTDAGPTIIVLEGICAIEVLRIALGDLPGNLVLGTVLHGIRLTAIAQILPRASPSHWTIPGVLLSWSVTEVSRYPMYMFPQSDLCRSVRMVVPLLTFPVGAFSEGYGAYLVLRDGETPGWLRFVLVVVLFVNGVLGPTMAYPALLRKGLPVLGLGKKREERPAKKME